MSGNTFGKILSLTTFGESHGPEIGGVLDGIQSGFPINEDFIKECLNRRKSNDSIDTPRKEDDEFSIVSGVFEGKTTGAPITIILKNKDAHSSDYTDLKDYARPGHADETWSTRYSNHDYRGGGRASARETAARVALGAIAIDILKSKGIEIQCCVNSVGGVKAEEFPPNEKDLLCLKMLTQMYKDKGDTVGGSVRCKIKGLPIGLGEPIFDKLDALLAYAMIGLPAVKGIEFGSGFKGETNPGSENNLPLYSGGALGGLSDGTIMDFKLAIKAIPTIDKEQMVKNLKTGQLEKKTFNLRHDYCACFRICAVVEAMAALVILDLWYQRYGR